MKKNFRFMAMAVVAMAATVFTGCSSDDDFLMESMDSVTTQTRPATWTSYEIDFTDVPAAYTASDKYGANLYSGSSSQITTGYIQQLGTTGTYIQFPINYLPQEWESGQPWRYEFHNGGLAVSNFTDITDGSYLNQCSVYNNGEAGYDNDKFVVAFGYSDWYNDPDTTYDKCAKIYLTDATGYRVTTVGSPVTGTAKSGCFNSVRVCNTTYGHLVMENGNAFTSGSLSSQNGWFKVQFIGFNANNVKTGTVDFYLANFDSSLTTISGLDNEIREGWQEVDLIGLGNNVSTVVINFVGSDTGNYGLNTPAYCALDNLSVSLN